MENAKIVNVPIASHFKLFIGDCSSSIEEQKEMINIPYVNAVGNLIYLMVCTRRDLAYVVSLVNMYMRNPGMMHWHVVNHILIYIKGSINVDLCSSRKE